ncbi:TPA: GhoT/OrtT family toxin, partial [Escherichia coli]|nr:GhoT/OrtT family toxin [Shigella sonnei]HDI8384683.1 GhoT/OrtT family toxin [Escherichia coli]
WPMSFPVALLFSLF